MKKILYAITGHGFGHASRSLTIANLLTQRFADSDLTLSTTVDEDAVRRFIPQFTRFELRRQDYEPGLLQANCFEVDTEATREQYRLLSRQLDQRIDAEARYLANSGFDAVISDIAAIPLAAAARLGLPAVAIGNFTWDWILEPLIGDCDELQRYHHTLQRHYASAALYLRLPFHAVEHPFQRLQEAPLIGRRSRLPRRQILDRLGLAENDKRPLILVTVGGWDSSGLQSIDIQQCSDYRFLVIGDLPIRAEHAELIRLPFALCPGINLPDLVQIADAGVVKPGYGTCAEFVINQTAMVGIERKHNREAGVLDRAVSARIPFSPISLTDFFAGNWQPALATVLDQEVPDYREPDEQIAAMIEQLHAQLHP